MTITASAGNKGSKVRGDCWVGLGTAVGGETGAKGHGRLQSR